MNVKSRGSKEKHAFNAVSKTTPRDIYERSETRQRGEVRQDLISSVKKKINSGFYQSADVLEQLSDSFATALNSTL